MKKIKNTAILFSIMSAFLLSSCLSTPEKSQKSPESDEYVIEEPEVQQKVIREPKMLSVQNTASEKENEFKELLSRIELKIVSTPNTKRPVIAGNPFQAPYVISVKDQNGPVADFNVTISWPVSRSNDTITYSTAQMQTDAQGKIVFLPGIPSIAVKDKITFYPSPVTSSSAIVQAAYASAVTAPYVVKSKYTTYPGGILFVYDYNEKGNPTTNNFTLLQILRNSDINAGNAPISEVSYLSKSHQEIYKACLDVTGGEIKKATNFLIIGSFKYAKPAEENNGSATVTLVSEITCLDMKDGSVKYKTTITDSQTDKTKWNAETLCKQTLAQKVADAIIYGM
ncbi:MAG: hypothetical protein K6E78_04545 [Treponema sp.]|nr:hypothetical protein [Treponema sp.]